MTKNTLNFKADMACQFVTNLLNWFQISKRKLPFRETKDPYTIWISEIMAQQTQIDTLIPYYLRFIATFPTVKALAKAPEDTVLKLWEGLGYYSRAKNLHKAAKMIMAEHNGIFPENYNTLIQLPGIGPYTGGAIASIAFNEPVPAIDGNVLRVVSRFNNYDGDIGESPTKKAITDWVSAALPDTSGDFNEALMELGALICTPTNPKCLLCPEQALCQSYQAGTTDKLPVKAKKNRQKKLNMEVGIVSLGKELFFIKRPDKGLLSGLWGFPIVPEDKEAPGHAIRKTLSTFLKDVPKERCLGTSKHVFSHVIWNMTVYHFELNPTRLAEAPAVYGATPAGFKDHNALANLMLPTAFSKLLKML